jgi:hypothetical protein
MSKRPTKKEREHLSRVKELGCLICNRPAEIHHLRTGQGMGQRASHYNTIPLCPEHHRTGGYGVAIHAGQKTFEAQNGTEIELLRLTLEKLASMRT